MDNYYKTDAVAVAEDGMRIVSAVVGDFNRDGFLDLITSQQPSDRNAESHEALNHRLWLGNGTELVAAPLPKWSLPSSIGEFILLDWRGRMLIDMLGVAANDVSGRFSVWEAQTAPSEDGNPPLVSGFALRPVEYPSFCRPVLPQSHAYADFNGDGFPDLLLVCEGDARSGDPVLSSGSYLELWISATEPNASTPTFKEPMRYALPRGHGPIRVADMNGDGAVDLVFGVCDPPESCLNEHAIHILYNTQTPFCTGSIGKVGLDQDDGAASADGNECRNVAKGLLAGEAETFGFDFTAGSAYHVRVNMQRALQGTSYRLMTQNPLTKESSWLAVGDFDVDGFPDVLVPVWDTTGEGTSRVILMRSVGCSDWTEQCTKAQQTNVSVGPRTLQRVVQGTTQLESVTGVLDAAWINFYQDGPPDVLLNTKNGVQTVQNGFVQDAFFFRCEVLNGADSTDTGVLNPKHSSASYSGGQRRYGASFPGPTIKFSFTDFDGSLRVRGNAQGAQAGCHQSLATPFSFFGLGRTNSFVETLWVRTPARDASNLAARAGLVPNSDLVIRPPEPANSAQAFRFELHIMPGRYFLWVLLSVATAMLVLGIFTALFKWREVKEDEEERRRALHAINFDAL
jgi:integrin alpha FG-GAP repeat containing protein 1